MKTYNLNEAFRFALTAQGLHGDHALSSASAYAAACVADGAAVRKNGRCRPVRRATAAWVVANKAYRRGYSSQ